MRHHRRHPRRPRALMLPGIACLLLVPTRGVAQDAPGPTNPMRRDDADRLAFEARRALDRYLESWNSQEPARWAASLHFPHVRPGPGAFELTTTPEEYAAGVNFEQTRATGWHHSEWTDMRVLQISPDKVHVAGAWRRYRADGTPMIGSAITYVVTGQGGRWGVQSRFAAGPVDVEAATVERNRSDALAALRAWFEAWNSHDLDRLAGAQHYPFVRIADREVEIARTPAEFQRGSEAGRQRTWYETRLDQAEVVQVSAAGVNVTGTYSRRGRGGDVISRYEALYLLVLRDGAWKLQAVSTFGP